MLVWRQRSKWHVARYNPSNVTSKYALLSTYRFFFFNFAVVLYFIMLQKNFNRIYFECIKQSYTLWSINLLCVVYQWIELRLYWGQRTHFLIRFCYSIEQKISKVDFYSLFNQFVSFSHWSYKWNSIKNDSLVRSMNFYLNLITKLIHNYCY